MTPTCAEAGSCAFHRYLRLLSHFGANAGNSDEDEDEEYDVDDDMAESIVAGGSSTTRLERLPARTVRADNTPGVPMEDEITGPRAASSSLMTLSSSSSPSSSSSSLSLSSLSSSSSTTTSSSSFLSLFSSSSSVSTQSPKRKFSWAEFAFSQCLAKATNDGYSECFCRAAFSTSHTLRESLALRPHLGDPHGPLAFLCERPFTALLPCRQKRRRLLRSARNASILRGDYSYSPDDETAGPSTLLDEWSLWPLELDVRRADVYLDSLTALCSASSIVDQPLSHIVSGRALTMPSPAHFLVPAHYLPR